MAAPDLYDLLVKQGIMTQAQADAQRAAANKPATVTTTATTTKPTTNLYPSISSPTEATALINKVFQNALKRNATAEEMKYWKPLLKAAQESGGGSQTYKVKGKTGVQTTITGLNDEVWLEQQLATNTAYKKDLPKTDYTAELNAVKITDPTLFARLQDKKIYVDAITAAAGDQAKIDAANETTTYGRGLSELLSSIQALAESNGATNTPEELAALATKLYDKGIAPNSTKAAAEVNAVLKTATGLVKDQPADLVQRAADKKIYDKLMLEAGSDPAKIQNVNDTTAYGRGLKELTAAIQAKAQESNATNTPEEIATLAKTLFDKGILLTSSEGTAQLDAMLKTEAGLVKGQETDLLKIAADKKVYEKQIAAAGNDPAKIQKVMDTTAYGRGLKEILAALQTKASDTGAINTPDELKALAQSLYDKGTSLNSFEGLNAINAVLKTKDGLVKDQPADLLKLAADKKIYDDLVSKANGDPAAIAKAKETTAYGRGLTSIEASIKNLADISGASNDPTEITALAQSLYDKGIDPNSAIGKNQINSVLKFGADAKTGKYKGTAATTVSDLQATALANGLDLQKNFGDKIQGWLTAINNGEQIDTIKQQIRDIAKLGQPDSIKKMIDNGIDLKTIYSPYKSTMSSVLEIQDPNQIDLNDPSLRMAITPNGEMNLYDYQKALRKDNRWQYTQQANAEVADATQKILKDFGFMG